MKRMLPLGAVLVVGIAIGIAVCSKSDPDPYAKYRDVQLKRGMKIADLKQQFGEPDSFDESGIYRLDHESQEYQRYAITLKYGAFGAHHQKVVHVTRYRLEMTFADGKLRTWSKSTPGRQGLD